MVKSIWFIALFALIAAVVLVVVMSVLLDELQKGDAGNQLRLAQAVREKFRLEGINASVLEEGGKRFLSIRYSTRADTNFDAARQTKEMEEVGAFALEKYAGEKKYLEEVRVHRIELRGRGCWTGKYEAKTALPNPHRKQ